MALQTKLADVWRLSELLDELRMRRRHVSHRDVEKFPFICNYDKIHTTVHLDVIKQNEKLSCQRRY